VQDFLYLQQFQAWGISIGTNKNCAQGENKKTPKEKEIPIIKQNLLS
jgi:hypothetical protein